MLLVVATGLMLGRNLFSGGPREGSGGNDIYYAYPTAFSPAPLTFAVWGPIFIGLIAFTVYQALPSQRHDPRLDRLGVPMLLALLANAASPFPAIGYSNLLILAMLLTLVWAYRILLALGPQDRWFRSLVRLPIVMFLTWIGVATVLNTCQWLTSLGLAITPPVASTLVLTTAVAGAVVVALNHEPAIAAVLAWAYLGILAARPDRLAIIAAVATGCLVLVAGLVLSTLSGRGRGLRSVTSPGPGAL